MVPTAGFDKSTKTGSFEYGKIAIDTANSYLVLDVGVQEEHKCGTLHAYRRKT